MQNINAEIKIANYSIDKSYTPDQIISGWVNLSLKNEPVDILLSAFSDNITIKQFLQKNSAIYNCFPSDCITGYSYIGDETSSKTLSINERTSKLIGIRLINNASGVSNFYFNVTTNAGKSCVYPISIDLLDDGLIDYKYNRVSNTDTCYTGNNPYGCFDNNSPRKNLTQMISNTIYCEKINVTAQKGFKVGARLNGSGNQEIKLSVKLDTTEKEKSIVVNQSGEISTIIEMDEELQGKIIIEGEFCISIVEPNGGLYSIYYEDDNPCGFSQVGSEQLTKHDFEIFAYPLKYNNPLTNFRFDQDLMGNNGIVLTTKISDYIAFKYSGVCSPECIIPIRIYSGINQNVNIFNLKLDYISQSLANTKNTFYEVIQSQPTITIDYKKLDLAKSDIKVPSSFGKPIMHLYLANTKIYDGEIEVKRAPKIKQVIPTSVPALYPKNFYIILDEPLNTSYTYTWDFGDSTIKETTTVDNIKHTYSKTGEFDLVVTASKANYGESSLKTKIKVLPPKEGVLNTIKEYKSYVNNISSSYTNALPWVRIELNKKINIDDIMSRLNAKEEEYNEATGDDYTKIMQELIAMKVPKQVIARNDLKDLKYIPNKGQIDYDIWESLQDESIDEKDDEEKKESYFQAINNWVRDNLDIVIETKTYVAKYDSGSEEDILAYTKIDLKAKNRINDYYLVLNGDPNKIIFDPASELKTKEFEGTGIGITFSEIEPDDTKSVEFLYPTRINIMEMPFFIVPNSKETPVIADIGTCNNNGVCESGEDTTNCRSDCKPWKWTMIFLLILILLTLIVYLGLQEWYKRRYENYLFLNKNQLYNLINYMNNAYHQGQTKQQIISKLKEFGWKGEQLEYAWKKLLGQRTGMWEIPVFKWIDNKKVKEELNKRKGITGTNSVNLK